MVLASLADGRDYDVAYEIVLDLRMPLSKAVTVISSPESRAVRQIDFFWNGVRENFDRAQVGIFAALVFFSCLAAATTPPIVQQCFVSGK